MTSDRIAMIDLVSLVIPMFFVSTTTIFGVDGVRVSIVAFLRA